MKWTCFIPGPSLALHLYHLTKFLHWAASGFQKCLRNCERILFQQLFYSVWFSQKFSSPCLFGLSLPRKDGSALLSWISLVKLWKDQDYHGQDFQLNEHLRDGLHVSIKRNIILPWCSFALMFMLPWLWHQVRPRVLFHEQFLNHISITHFKLGSDMWKIKW